MNLLQFVESFFSYAFNSQKTYGVPFEVALAQSILETGYGKFAPGNMMFGVKAGSNWKGDKQLIKTTEYHDTDKVKYPEIIRIEKQPNGKYLYTVRDYFRKYPTPQESFNDYAIMLTKNFKTAFQYSSDPFRFAKELALRGYATDPNYYSKLESLIKDIQAKKKLLKLQG
ncbi:MAG: glucosaminidase domain-containing protein [Bacteroidales bacterium]|nr:glucosaminidase domain-containing protein [Bacteroidales bacterium]